VCGEAIIECVEVKGVVIIFDLFSRCLKVSALENIPPAFIDFTTYCIRNAPVSLLMAIGGFVLSAAGCAGTVSDDLGLLVEIVWILVLRIGECEALFELIDLLFDLYRTFPLPMDNKLTGSVFSGAVSNWPVVAELFLGPAGAEKVTFGPVQEGRSV
jgi:hypothetical protein